MAQIICPKCKCCFDNNNGESFVTRGAALSAGAASGAYVGSSVGVAGGPFGAVNGLWIGAAVGGITGWLAGDQFRRCPECRKVFKT